MSGPRRGLANVLQGRVPCELIRQTAGSTLIVKERCELDATKCISNVFVLSKLSYNVARFRKYVNGYAYFNIVIKSTLI